MIAEVVEGEEVVEVVEEAGTEVVAGDGTTTSTGGVDGVSSSSYELEDEELLLVPVDENGPDVLFEDAYEVSLLELDYS